MFRLIPTRTAAIGASLAATLAAVLLAAPNARADLEVVASIKPIHSLVAGVMEGDRAPGLIIQGRTSPHSYSLRPSDARRLQDADLVFWIGHSLEAFLKKPIESLGPHTVAVKLLDAPGVAALPVRTGATFETDDHSDGDHGDGPPHANMPTANTRMAAGGMTRNRSGSGNLHNVAMTPTPRTRISGSIPPTPRRWSAPSPRH